MARWLAFVFRGEVRRLSRSTLHHFTADQVQGSSATAHPDSTVSNISARLGLALCMTTFAILSTITQARTRQNVIRRDDGSTVSCSAVCKNRDRQPQTTNPRSSSIHLKFYFIVRLQHDRGLMGSPKALRHLTLIVRLARFRQSATSSVSV